MMSFLGMILIGILALIYSHKRGVPVFLFHEVNNESGTSPEMFEKYIKYIKEKNITTFTAKEAYEYMEKNGKLPKNSALITFDDGYYDNYSIVYPILMKYNVKATIFFNSAYANDREDRTNMVIKSARNANMEAVDTYIDKGTGTPQYMSWEEMAEMEKSGLVEIEAHTRRHFLVFSSNVINYILEDENSPGWHSSNRYIFGQKPQKGFPVFKLIGETAAHAYIYSKEFFDLFKKFYDENYAGDKNGFLSAANRYVREELKDYYRKESDREFEKRIKEEIRLNRNAIEQKLGGKREFFAWPWGIYTSTARHILKKEGIKGFFSCKRGTNTRKFDWNNVRRNSLRVNSELNFKIRLLITQNLLLGKIYEILS